MPALARSARDVAVETRGRKVDDLGLGEFREQFDIDKAGVAFFLELDIQNIVEVPAVETEGVHDVAYCRQTLQQQAQRAELSE